MVNLRRLVPSVVKTSCAGVIDCDAGEVVLPIDDQRDGMVMPLLLLGLELRRRGRRVLRQVREAEADARPRLVDVDPAQRGDDEVARQVDEGLPRCQVGALLRHRDG